MMKLETIKNMIKDSNWHDREAAMNACIGREVPIEWIETGLKDPEWCVREAAKEVINKNELTIR